MGTAAVAGVTAAVAVAALVVGVAAEVAVVGVAAVAVAVAAAATSSIHYCSPQISNESCCWCNWSNKCCC